MRLTHFPALDGLRGVAVVAVLLFHGGKLTGGYLGVDLFFVLSGFLITSLLLVEWNKRRSVDLKAFWIRRARRLLPAMFGLIAVVAVLALVLAQPGDVGQWRGDSLSTLLYSANWHQLTSGQGYWDQFSAPSPLHHTWSLAIEEQFYLVWPLIVVGLLKLTNGSKRALLIATLGGVFLSSTVMWIVWQPDNPNRAYLGTDTRAAAMLLGAAAAIWYPRRGPARTTRERRNLEIVAVVSSLGLLLAWLTIDGSSTGLYHYGFLACELAAVTVIISAIQPERGPVGSVLHWRPLRALGLISYGLYLWHWPIYLVIDANQQRLPLGDWGLLALKLLLSLAAAVVSYQLLEQPIRRFGLHAWGRPVLVPATAGFVVIALLWSTLGNVDPSDASSTDGALPVGAEARGALPELSTSEQAVAQPVAFNAAGGPTTRPSGRKARLMVVGDSVGWFVGTNMDRVSRDLNITVANRAMPECPLDRGAGRNRDGPTHQARLECRQWPKLWREDVERFRPDVVVMMFHGPPPEAREINGAFEPVCGDAFRDEYRAELTDAIDLLSEKGAVVYIAPSAYVRAPKFNFATLDERVDCVTKIFDAAIAAKPNARRLSLDRYVCPDHTCRERVDGIPLRDDGIHYKNAGATHIARWIVQQTLSSV